MYLYQTVYIRTAASRRHGEKALLALVTFTPNQIKDYQTINFSFHTMSTLSIVF